MNKLKLPDLSKDALTNHPSFIAFTEGVGKGFLLYFLPVTVLRRKVKKTVMRRAIAIGIFCGVVRIVRYFTQFKEEEAERCLQRARSSKQNILVRLFEYVRGHVYKHPCHVAGAVGAVAACTFDPAIAQSQLLAIWLLVRALRCISPSIPHGSVIAMCLSAAQILSCYARAPWRLDTSYLRFLEIHGGLQKPVLSQLRERTDIASLCSVIHPDTSCPSFLLSFFGAGFRRAIRVYAPLYVVFFLFSRSKNVSFLVQNLIRSSAFLSLYCTLAWLSGCVFHRIFPNTPLSRVTLFLHAGFAGLATLLERENRRAELAAYCATYALDSAMKSVTDRIPKIPFLNVFLMSIAMAILVRYRKEQPWIFSHFMLGDEHPLTKEKETEVVE